MEASRKLWCSKKTAHTQQQKAGVGEKDEEIPK
jgi:hypothetical protein